MLLSLLFYLADIVAPTSPFSCASILLTWRSHTLQVWLVVVISSLTLQCADLSINTRLLHTAVTKMVFRPAVTKNGISKSPMPMKARPSQKIIHFNAHPVVQHILNLTHYYTRIQLFEARRWILYVGIIIVFSIIILILSSRILWTSYTMHATLYSEVRII